MSSESAAQAKAQAVSWRLATVEDALAIARIYNQGIQERVATFEDEPRSTAEVAALLDAKGDRYPTVVVERDGVVLAWAWASAYSTRGCYAGIAEHSVYVERSARGQGLGAVALNALIETYEKRGYWKLVSRIFPENKASLSLHERCGFRVVGTHKRHAKLDGVWRDTVMVERVIEQD